jgi:MoaA/NifB/PqqE/SkfB family radical SAM enzyme
VIDEEIIEGLIKNGNVVTFFSIEGYEADTDYWRGKGVFKSITESAHALKQNKILFGYSCLIHSKNMEVITSRDFIEFLSDSGAKFCLLFPYGPMGEKPQYDYVLTESQIEEIYLKLDKLQSDFNMLLLKEGYNNPVRKKLFYLERGCRAGATIHITPDGKVEPCNGIQFYKGNVFDEGLKSIFQSTFLREIVACTEENNCRCIGMFEPHRVWDIILKNDAKPSNQKAFKQYSNYAEFHKRRILEKDI